MNNLPSYLEWVTESDHIWMREHFDNQRDCKELLVPLSATSLVFKDIAVDLGYDLVSPNLKSCGYEFHTIEGMKKNAGCAVGFISAVELTVVDGTTMLCKASNYWTSGFEPSPIVFDEYLEKKDIESINLTVEIFDSSGSRLLMKKVPVDVFVWPAGRGNFVTRVKEYSQGEPDIRLISTFVEEIGSYEEPDFDEFGGETETSKSAEAVFFTMMLERELLDDIEPDGHGNLSIAHALDMFHIKEEDIRKYVRSLDE